MPTYTTGLSNQIVNGSFELPGFESSWRNEGAPASVPVRELGDARQGSYYLTGGITINGQWTGPSMVPAAYIPCSPGQTVGTAMSMWSSRAGQGFQIQIVFWQANKTTAISAPGGWNAVRNANGWYDGYFTAVAPAGTVYVSVQTLCTGYTTVAGDVWKMDLFTLKVGGALDEPFDGNSGPAYGWVGLPFQSASYRAAYQGGTPPDNTPGVSPSTWPDPHLLSGKDGVVRMVPKLYKASRGNVLGDDISEYLINGKVEYRSDRTIKGQFTGTLLEADMVTPYVDYLAPFLEFQYEDGTIERSQYGLYSMEPAPETVSESSRQAGFVGQDLTWLLNTAVFAAPYTLAAGANPITAVQTILTAQGLSRYAITAYTGTTAEARTWPRKTTILGVINDIFESVGYYSLSADMSGVLTSFPYRDLATTAPSLLLTTGNDSIVTGAIAKTPNLTTVANAVLVVKEGPTPAETITSYLENTSVDSPVSIVNVGRTLLRVIEVQDIASQAVADATAKAALEEGASVYTNYTIKTFPTVARGLWEVYGASVYMSDGSDALVGKARCSGWDMGFSGAALAMTHYLNRLEAYQ